MLSNKICEESNEICLKKKPNLKKRNLFKVTKLVLKERLFK